MAGRLTRSVLAAAVMASVASSGCENMKEAGAAIGAIGGAAIGYGIAKAAGADDGTAIAVAVGAGLAGGIIGYQVGAYIEKRRAEEAERQRAEELVRQQQSAEEQQRRQQRFEQLEQFEPPADAPTKAVATEVKPNTWVMVDPETGVAGDDAYVLSDEESAKLRATRNTGQLARIDNYTVAVN